MVILERATPAVLRAIERARLLDGCRKGRTWRCTVATPAAQVVLRSSEHHLEHHLSVTAGPPESRPWMDFSILVTRCHGQKRRFSSCQGGRRGFKSLLPLERIHRIGRARTSITPVFTPLARELLSEIAGQLSSAVFMCEVMLGSWPDGRARDVPSRER